MFKIETKFNWKLKYKIFLRGLHGGTVVSAFSSHQEAWVWRKFVAGFLKVLQMLRN